MSRAPTSFARAILRPVALGTGLAGLLAAQAAAQAVAKSVAKETVVASARDLPASRRTLESAVGTETPVAPTIVVTGPPRSYQIVSVAVPEGLPRNRPIKYEIVESGLVQILGSLKGSVPLDSGLRRRILVTVPVPATSRAGTIPVARVRFFAEGAAPVDVPLQVAILPQQRLELTALEGLRAVRPGESFTLSFHLTNLGNAPDTVEVRVMAAPGWRIAAQGSMTGITVEVRGVIARALTITVPYGNPTGSASVQLVALSHGQPLATAEVQVRLLENPGNAVGAGPRFVAGAGVAAGVGGSPASAYSASLEGQLTSGIRVSARAAVVANANADALYGLSRAGLYRISPSLLLTSEAWGLGLGVTSARLTEQTGINVGGQGAALDLRFRRWGASTYLAHPQGGEDRIDGSLAGGRLDVRLGAATVTGSASHLVEERLDRRRLDAFAIGASLPGVFAGVLSSEVARRRFEGGSGLGWSAGYERRQGASQLSLRLGHFPGGNAAFARATDEVHLSAGQRLTRQLGVAGSWYRNADASRIGLTSLVTAGWSFGGQAQLSQGLTMGATARRSSFSADGTFGGFGNRETALDGSFALRHGGVYGTLQTSLASVERLTTSASGTRLREAGPRTTTRGAVGAGGRLGLLEMTAAYERGGTAAGYLARQAEFGLRAEQFPLVERGNLHLLASGSVIQRYWFGERSALTSLGAGLTAELAGGIAITASAERNPFIVTARGIGGWFYALKIERTTLLPQISHETARGAVFTDRNGNGFRDPGEPGFAGVLVRSGSRSTVSGLDGSFRFGGRINEPVSIDDESLPLGWIAGKAGAKGSRPELAVVAVAAVEVALTMSPAVGHRVPAEELTKAVVMARDEKGRTWIARMSAPGHLVFDALPPGRYRVELDLSDIQEPLTPTVGLPEFDVGATVPTPRFEIELRARSVKITRLNPAGVR